MTVDPCRFMSNQPIFHPFKSSKTSAWEGNISFIILRSNIKAIYTNEG